VRQAGQNGIAGYRRRYVDTLLGELVAGLPAVRVVGPRASGKTTTARRYAKGTANLANEAESAAFAADPDAALARLAEPALLDEWQDVPAVLGAVKRAVDADPRPGRFIMTGSVRSELEGATWPATGRVARLPVFPMTVAELDGWVDEPMFVDRITAPDSLASASAGRLDLFGYLEAGARGGFPDAALNRSGKARSAWLESYIYDLLHRDVRLTGRDADPEKLSAYLEALAAMSAGVVEQATLRDAAGIAARTASAYDGLLADVYIAEQVPAWWSNRLGRLTALSKRYLLDTSLMAAVLREDIDSIAADADLLGRFLDTFVAMQLRPQLAVSRRRPKLRHLRDKGGRHEVDLILEYPKGLVAGLEVKATASPQRRDAAHLAWLRERLGDKFAVGLVLHTGPGVIDWGDRLGALPISALWAW
jgi:predicted AAA+ superfamily ATPase